MGSQEVFIIDANSLITPFKEYYAFDIAPKFWTSLKTHIETGRVLILDCVKDEITTGDDKLSEWINSFDSKLVISKVTEDNVKVYGKIMNYIKTSGLYKDKALHYWSDIKTSDPWLLAVARVKGITLVSEENGSGGISVKNPNKYPKIPDVAKAFGVETIKVYEMVRRLNMKI